MDKLVNYVECDYCGNILDEGDYANTSGDGHVFCCLTCALEFYGVCGVCLKKSNETQLVWEQRKEMEETE